MTVANDIDVLEATERRLTKTARENAKLKKEANRLRAKVQPGQWDRILMSAHEDAKLILHLKHTGMPVSRRILQEMGLVSEYKYGWALGLMRYANIDRSRVDTLERLDTALQRLEGSVAWLEENASDRLIEVRVKCSKKHRLYRKS